MKNVQGTNTEFLCVPEEVVTIVVSPKNTDLLYQCEPENSEVSKEGDTVTVRVGETTKVVVLTFEFNGAGGYYSLNFTGTDGGNYRRGVLQPSSGLPAVRAYVFHV